MNQSTEPAVNLDELEQLSRSFQTASPQTLETLWRNVSPSFANAEAQRQADGTARAAAPDQAELIPQMILTKWAAKDGRAAVSALLNLSDGKLRQQTFPKVMEAWANSNPYAASQWYLSPERAAIRESQDLVAGSRFADRIVRWASLNDIDTAVNSLNTLQHSSEVCGGVNALESVAETTGLSKEALKGKLDTVEKHKDFIRAFQQFRESAKLLKQSVGDRNSREELRRLMRDFMGAAGDEP